MCPRRVGTLRAVVTNTDPRVDTYIEEAPDYSRPILKKLRRLFHRADPALEETIKWPQIQSGEYPLPPRRSS